MREFLSPLLAAVALPAVYAAAQEPLPWEAAPMPREVAESALHPDWVFNEQPCDWRRPVSAIFRPLVRDCTTAREAVLRIASQMTAVTGVYYSMERRKANMNALEALAEKKVSCTGQSILLACALRSVGIPARAVGVLTWNHVRGNHTWTEAWFDGSWHMIEFNEKDFNTPWVMENIGMLRPERPEQRIYAVGSSAEKLSFPFPDVARRIPAEDVTERYLALSRRWYEQAGLPPGCQRLMVDVDVRRDEPETVQLLDAAGKVVAEALLPTRRDDVRRYATLLLPEQGRYTLLTPFGAREVVASEMPVRIIRLVR